MAGWDVSQLIRNMGWLAKLGAAEFGWVRARDARPMVRGSALALNAFCMHLACSGYAGQSGVAFERGFLGIVEELFVIG